MLEKINKPQDIKALSPPELEELAADLRKLIIETTSRNGGHLAANLGVVELTIALFRVLDMPQDKIIWDVGHQSYTHKILSGRREEFESLRKTGGLSGFPKREESDFDAFDTGHSSTSISAGLGMALAGNLKGESFKVVSVIGDGALTGGMAYEALNNASEIRRNFIIILNDNNMSISRNVGGITKYLNALRTGTKYNKLKKDVETALRAVPLAGDSLVRTVKRAKDSVKKMMVPGMFFEEMGITYLGPVDGHDIAGLEKAIRNAEKVDHAVLLHVITKKGKGYGPAEKDPEAFHGVGRFDVQTGRIPESAGKTYTDVFSDTLLELAERDPSIVAVTAAMPVGTGLTAFADKFPDRFFDVGIAEQHAVTSAAGMAAAGLKPVFAVYSSFLQRGFDQLVHDVCLQRLHVVFAVDRAGLVGSDGETHQGIFDLSFLSMIPGLIVMAPKNAEELKEMLALAFREKGPVAIRYPRGIAYTGLSDMQEPLETGRAELLHQGKDTALFALGSMVSTAEHIRLKLAEEGLDLTLVNARFAKPLDFDMIDRLCAVHGTLVTLEENVRRGGIGTEIAAYVQTRFPNVRVLNVTLPDRYVEHGDVTALRSMLGIDSDSVIRQMREKGII